MKLLTPELEQRFLEVGDQSQNSEPMVVAKFFDPVGSATWYATEYDPKSRIFYGYVTGLACNEWGSFSLDELESIQRPFGLSIERDLYFIEKSFHHFVPKLEAEIRKDRLELVRTRKENEPGLEP